MIFALPDETYANFRIPGLVLTQANTLLACCECRRSGSDWAEIDLVVRRSTDEGNTWTQTLFIPGNGNTMNNPMLTVVGDKILFMYHLNYRRLFICESCDDGQTFSAPREIEGVFEEGGFFYNVAAIGPGHGIVKDGVVLLPIWFGYNREDEKAHNPSFVATIYSKDAGETWHLGEVFEDDEIVNPSECALAVWQDQVIISIRNENVEHRRAFAVSTNGYSDWSKPTLVDHMVDPICQGSMAHTDDAVYHINCDDPNGRVNLTIKVSRDGFKTYDRQLIDTMGGYADIAVGDAVYVLYEKDWGKDGLFFVRLATL